MPIQRLNYVSSPTPFHILVSVYFKRYDGWGSLLVSDMLDEPGATCSNIALQLAGDIGDKIGNGSRKSDTREARNCHRSIDTHQGWRLLWNRLLFDFDVFCVSLMRVVLLGGSPNAPFSHEKYLVHADLLKQRTKYSELRLDTSIANMLHPDDQEI